MKNKVTRREFLAAGGIATAGFLLSNKAEAETQMNPATEELSLYIGTYTNKGSDGIYLASFDAKTGAISQKLSVKNVVQPSFLAVSNNGKFVYAVNETDDFDAQKSGYVSAFSVDPKTGDLRLLNKQTTKGGAPCHISLTTDGKFAVVANYTGGNVALFPIGADGSLEPASDSAQHSGSGPRKDRQEAAHAHSATFDRQNRFVFAADLGIDKIVIYRLDTQSKKLTGSQSQTYFLTKSGAGPRHFTFHPNDKLAFVINELDSTITSLSFDEKSGSLSEVQTVPTLPAGYSGSSTCADIHVSPDGNFVYGSNRGHDSLVVYKIDQSTGQLEFVEHVSCGGRKPRNFVIDPTGNYLLAANQDSNSVVVFKRDVQTGKLTKTDKSLTIPTPVCLKFAPRAA
jgi:6-phosphogluconolactonase